MMSDNGSALWSAQPAELLQQLQASAQGLSSGEATQRLLQYGQNRLKPKKQGTALALLAAQFTSPLVLLLAFAAVLSLFLHDPTDALIILLIVLLSGLLGFWQEKGAKDAVDKLLTLVSIKASVLRDSAVQDLPVEEVVPGDAVLLSAGTAIPADCRILESKDLFVDESTLTGESYPVEKGPGVFPAEIPLSQRTNCLFLGTHVVSGTAKAVVVCTGGRTEFGKISERLRLRPPETGFEQGVRQFGYFLLEITLLLVVGIFAVNVHLERPVFDSFLFALALAVGLTPQLLPAIISVNLAYGARRMARNRVIVKRLAAIENFGSMNVLCSDKTGTLTEGSVRLHQALSVEGTASQKVLLYGYMNAFYETGFRNPIDEAIRSYRQFDLAGYQKLDELPYDFVRKRLSILVSHNGKRLMITKGALGNILNACAKAETTSGEVQDLARVREQVEQQFALLSAQGLRTLGLAYRDIAAEAPLAKDQESEMTFLGYLVFYDPPQKDIRQTILELGRLGVSIKVITGDNHLVASHLMQQIGLPPRKLLTGSELHEMPDEALLRRVSDVDVFAEIEPNQKERIILALRKSGHVVGYMGDGINDASALHAADVGISVEGAADVAKEAADIVLLEKDLAVLSQGVREGRKTFANTLKYVFMATSANFGNMFSMAGASVLLPFLPLLPTQILLTNLLTDFPEMAIAADTVDIELVEQPRRWNIGFIRRFMLTFGLLSSIFDYMTFGILFFVIHATPVQFRTGWFLESVLSASLTVLVVRTRRPFFKSRPGKWLLILTLFVGAFTLAIPQTPIAAVFKFQPVSGTVLLYLGAIVLLYVMVAERVKRQFYRSETLP